MSCPQWQERVAALEQDSEVERHLAECAACRAFASEVERSLAALREAHCEEIPPACYAAVRARVVARIEGTRRHWIWRLAFAAATVFALLYPALVRLRPPVAPPPAAPPPPVYVARTVPREQARVRIPRPRPQPRTRSLEPAVIKILTDDPNVVIYWITGNQGE